MCIQYAYITNLIFVIKRKTQITVSKIPLSFRYFACIKDNGPKIVFTYKMTKEKNSVRAPSTIEIYSVRKPTLYIINIVI